MEGKIVHLSSPTSFLLTQLTCFLILLILGGQIVSCFSTAVKSQNCFIFVDPLDDFECTSRAVQACEERDVSLLKMWSSPIAKGLKQNALSTNDLEVFEALSTSSCPFPGPLSSWIVQNLKQIGEDVHNVNILGVLCESDIGLATAEKVQESLSLPTSNNFVEGRRDKYIMQELLKRRSLTSVRQVLTDDWDLVQSFLESLERPFPCVIKPARGAASVGVSKAHTLEEAKQQFHALLGTPGFANGTVSDAVLVQEWLVGTEFAVDTVSRDGEHKVVALWRYDKRQVNGAPFVYYCTELVQVAEVRHRDCGAANTAGNHLPSPTAIPHPCVVFSFTAAVLVTQ